MFLLKNNTTDFSGTYKGADTYINESAFDGPNKSVHCYGTFDGATVTLQCSPNPELSSAVWFDVASYTANDIDGVLFTSSGWRVVVTSAGASTDINLEVF